MNEATGIEPENQRGKPALFGRALALSWRASPGLAVVSLLAALVQGAVPAGLTWLTKLLLDGVADPSVGMAQQLPTVLSLGLLGALTALTPHGSMYLAARMQRSIGLVMQGELYGAVNRIDGIAAFESPRFLDRLSLAQQAAVTAPAQLSAAIFGLLQNFVAGAGFLVVLIAINPWIVAVALLAAFPSLLVQLAAGRREASMMWRMSPRVRRQFFYQMLMTEPQAAKEVRLFGLGSFLAHRMQEETRQVHQAEDKVDRGILYSNAPIALLGALVATGGLVWIIGGTTGGTQSVGDVAAFVGAVGGLQMSVGAAVTIAVRCQAALLMFAHYDEITDSKTGPARVVEPRPIRKLATEIEFRDVSFRYEGTDSWALRHVSFTIPAGSSIALVGENGAGKSTLVKLICRLYEPTMGAILWDGVDVREFSVTELRDRLSVVFQDYVAYELSASENIGLGDLARMDDQDAIVTAANEADVHSVLERLPLGYETMLSRTFFQGIDDEFSGVNLSGGQWQRIAIARAMFRTDRDLLVLDEPSAGLDANAEEAMHKRLADYLGHMTSILITHRLGAVRDANSIMVLDEGSVLEWGTHDELIAANGKYAQLFTTQAARYVP
jgi:ATP-binding cassette, subfamily B, bacterial